MANGRDDTRKQLGLAIITIAAGGLAALGSFITSARDLRIAFWILAGLSTVAIIMSIIAGGLGLANLGNPSKGYFNFQAWTCLSAWIFIALSLLGTAKPKDENAVLHERIGSLSARLDTAAKQVNDMNNRLERTDSSAKTLKDEVNNFGVRLTHLEEVTAKNDQQNKHKRD